MVGNGDMGSVQMGWRPREREKEECVGGEEDCKNDQDTIYMHINCLR